MTKSIANLDVLLVACFSAFKQSLQLPHSVLKFNAFPFPPFPSSTLQSPRCLLKLLYSWKKME